MRRTALCATWATALALLLPAAAAARAHGTTVRAGFAPRDAALRLDGPGLALRQRGAIAVRTPAGDVRATRIVRRSARSVTLATPDGRTRVAVTLRRAGDGALGVDVHASGGPVTGVRLAFSARRAERFLGFGERADAVEQRGRAVDAYVSDGPYPARDRAVAAAVTPPWALQASDDATYYPVPWLLSTRGYGVLVDQDDRSAFDLRAAARGTWAVTVDAATLRLRVFAGPRPADALRRFTAATGRQPAPPADWVFGPWFQTGQNDATPPALEREWTRRLRDGDAPVSVAETHLHYLPCGAQRGREAAERARVRRLHATGLAVLTYLNPLVCQPYGELFDRALATGAFQARPGGGAYLYPGFVGGSIVGSRTLGQLDFGSRAGRDLFAGVVREVVGDGHDGWMEDFGEYTPPDAVSASGQRGVALHNAYPRQFHCAAAAIARDQDRPLVRFVRSGWTGAARCATVVWGGDPTTSWRFDGLAAQVRVALSAGLSGIGRWGTDIGGYFSIGDDRLTPELLARWIQLGAVAGAMRSKGGGIAIPAKPRPQIWEPAMLPVWRRWAKLRTQLLPYWQAADATYRATGLPEMRQLVLLDPSWPRAARVDDEFGVGDRLLAAPVLRPGARRRRVWLPRGTWVDLWRSVRYVRATGGLAVHGARLLAGRRAVTLPAPRDELPLLARAGTILTLLPPDVDTLARTGRAPGLVHAADRGGRRVVVAFPRGRGRQAFGRGEAWSSHELRGGGWRLAVRARRARTYVVQAALTTLRQRLRPRTVLVDGRPLRASRWRFDARRGVLRATVRLGRRGVLAVRG